MSSLIDPVLQSKIAGWRQRAAEGTLTKEEMIEAVKLLRAGRISSAQAAGAAAAKRKVAIREIPKAGDLLDELEGL